MAFAGSATIPVRRLVFLMACETLWDTKNELVCRNTYRLFEFYAEKWRDKEIQAAKTSAETLVAVNECIRGLLNPASSFWTRTVAEEFIERQLRSARSLPWSP